MRVRWKRFSGITLGAVLLAFLIGETNQMERIEFILLDTAQRLVPLSVDEEDKVVVVAIDDLSISADSYDLGKWPWPRRVYAPVIDYLSRAGARAIGFDLYFPLEDVVTPENDRVFVASVMRAGNTCQAVAASDRIGTGVHDDVRAEIVDRFAIQCLESGRQFSRLIVPFSSLLDACDCLGQVNAPRDSDGVTRRIHVVTGGEGLSLPCLGLAMWLWEKDLTAEDITCRPRAVDIDDGAVTIPMDDEGKALLRFGRFDRSYVSFSSVLHAGLSAQEGIKPDWRGGSLPEIVPELFEDKMVIIALTASGLFDLVSTPLGGTIPGVEIQATALENIRTGGFLRPASKGWSWIAAVVLAAGVGLALRRWTTLAAATLTASSSGYPAERQTPRSTNSRIRNTCLRLSNKLIDGSPA